MVWQIQWPWEDHRRSMLLPGADGGWPMRHTFVRSAGGQHRYRQQALSSYRSLISNTALWLADTVCKGQCQGGGNATLLSVCAHECYICNWTRMTLRFYKDIGTFDCYFHAEFSLVSGGVLCTLPLSDKWGGHLGSGIDVCEKIKSVKLNSTVFYSNIFLAPVSTNNLPR